MCGYCIKVRLVGADRYERIEAGMVGGGRGDARRMRLGRVGGRGGISSPENQMKARGFHIFVFAGSGSPLRELLF